MKKIDKLKITLMITIFLTLIIGMKVYGITGIVNENVVYVRKSATTDSNILTYVTKEDKVDVIEKDGDWYKIKYKDTTGYIYSKYINVDESKVEPAEVETNINSETTAEPETTETSTESETNIESNNNVPAKLYIENETNLKIIPNITSSTIYIAQENKEISIVEQIGQWSYIKVDEVTGWVKTDKIKEENAITNSEEENKEEETENEENEEAAKEETPGKKAYIAYSTVNLREEASTSSKSLAKLRLNDEVTIIEEANSTWTKVKFGDYTGYVSTSLISDKKQEETKTESSSTSRSGDESNRQSSSSESKQEVKEEKKEEEKSSSSNKVTGQAVADYAQKFLGKSYVYGGTSPSTGFDCSGLTYYVYKQFGYTLNRSASGQASNGREVSKSELKPGDLVIFKNHALTKIGHVGLYIGNNKMIHASEPGVGVIITDIDSKAYKYPQRYVTARRIID